LSSLTLPGTIFGLLCKCSPVLLTENSGAVTGTIIAGQRGVVLMTKLDNIEVLVALEDGRTLWSHHKCLDLDLSNKTGVLHAAWWLEQQSVTITDGAECDAIDRALAGKSMNEQEVQHLVRACIRVAAFCVE